MSELQWDELDILECLGVVPEEGEHHEWYAYPVEQNGLRLTLSLWPFESMVGFSLYRVGNTDALFDFWVVVRGQIRRINDKRGDYLEFTDCIVTDSRFSYLERGNLFEENRFAGVDLELHIAPDIRLRVV